MVDVEKDLIPCLGKGGEFGVFQGKAFPHPLTEQAHSLLPVADGGITRQQPHFLRNAAKGMVQGQRYNDQQITGTFASPLQQ